MIAAPEMISSLHVCKSCEAATMVQHASPAPMRAISTGCSVRGASWLMQKSATSRCSAACQKPKFSRSFLRIRSRRSKKYMALSASIEDATAGASALR